MTEKFHKGEIFVQKRVGVHEEALGLSGMIDNHIPQRAVGFIKNQQLAIINMPDDNGKLWTFALLGQPGFIQSNSERDTLEIDISSSNVNDFSHLFIQEKSYGMLFIDLLTRIRLRVNGTISTCDEDTVKLSVEEAYPNCPKYIQRREIQHYSDSTKRKTSLNQSRQTITSELENVIRNADTFFVGSTNDNNQYDASHKGGHVGFVEIIDEHTIRIPDYKGNNLFNTFGNFHLNSLSSILFIDFNNGLQYHLTGNAFIEFDVLEGSEKTGGTSRWWEFKLDSWYTTKISETIGWEFLDTSPFLP